jgi:hypothetical protein
MTLVYSIVSTLVKKFLWQDPDVTSIKSLMKTGIAALVFSIIFVYLGKRSIRKQQVASIKNT